MAKKNTQNQKSKKILLATLIPVGVIAGAASITLPLVLNKKAVVEQEDKQKVDNINNLLENSYNTMSDLLDDLATKGIFLQTETTTAENKQFVWDKNKNVIFLMNEDNTIFYAPEGYTLGQNAAIWKMVKAPTASNTAVYADSFSSTSQYSQFLRDGEKFDKSLTFCSGLDTGSYEKLELTFKKELSQSTEPVVINTMKSTLTVEGSITDINHYGNLTELTVDSIDKDYNEYGSVDAAIKVRKGTINAQKGSDVNSVVVTAESAEDVQININSGGAIGAVSATKETVATEIESRVEVSEEAAVEPDVKTEVIPEPSIKSEFYSGFGTEKSPWTIKTADQLWNFADRVSSGVYPEEGQTHWYFNLIADIDMNDVTEECSHYGQKWTPVGTSAAAFKGIFNGCGFTISNLTIEENTKGYMGLFGYTNGEINSDFKVIKDEETQIKSVTAWDDSKNELVDGVIAEEKYDTRIINLTLNNVTSKAITNKSTKEVGSLVGRSLNTYISNVHITSGEIYGNKCVGGLAGAIHGSVLINCSTGTLAEDPQQNLKVTARTYHAGGMVGGCSYATSINASEAFISCTNFANVANENTDGAGGWAGGFVGICQQDQPDSGIGATIFQDCNNFGNVHAESGSAMGIAMSKRTWVYNRCNNFGNISTTNANHNLEYNLAGMGTDGNAKCVDCHNTGTISGWVDSIGGMIALGTSGALDNFGCFGCSCEPTLLSSDNNACVKASFVAGAKTIKITDATFANVGELKAAISSAGDSMSIEFENVTVTDTQGELSFPKSVRSVISDKPLAESYKIDENTSDITIDIPNINITVDGNFPNAYIRNLSDNSTLTVTEGSVVSMAGVSGIDSEVINNGTVNGAIYVDGYATYGENNGTCSKVAFGSTDLEIKGFGHGNKHFVNNGIVKRVAVGANEHVIDSIGGSDCNIVIDNYGTIEYEKTSSVTVPGYLMDFLNTGTIVFNCYEDSVFKSNIDGYVIALPIKNRMDINYKSSAILSVGGAQKQWTTLAVQGQIFVQEF